MQINNTGFIKATLTDYLNYMTSDIQAQGNFGSDFTIKKEGVIDNFLTTTSNAFVSLEDKFAFALKQLNPYTAEGLYQDWLYALVGLVRKYATETVVTRTISGTVGTTIGINELVFKTAQDDQFFLNTEVTIGQDGTAIGSFTAYESGAVPCDVESNLTIVSAPLGITAVYYVAEDNVTTIGDDYEDDSEFRARWIATNSAKGGTGTAGGLYTSLLELVDNNPKNLNIRQNRNIQEYLDFPLHTLNITLKSSASDNDIAQVILDNVTDGVGLDGNITVTLQDSEGTDVDISFSRATLVPIYFNVELVLKTNYTIDMVLTNVKKAIVDNFEYSMGERVIANDFYSYINAIDGVDYVTELQIKTGVSGVTWGQTIALDFDEFATVDKNNITVTEAE